MSGFARCFEVKNSTGMQTNTVNSSLGLHVKTGYWTALNGVSVPYGKFQWKDLGSGKDVCPLGIWFGLQDKYQIRMVNHVTPIKFEDFQDNVKVKKVPKLPGGGIFACCCGSKGEKIYLDQANI